MDPQIPQTDDQAVQAVESQAVESQEVQPPTSNRDIVFGDKPLATENEPRVSEEVDEQDVQSAEEREATLEVPADDDSTDIDIVNLGDTPSQEKESSQKTPQADTNAALKEQNALLTQTINLMQQQMGSKVQTPVQKSEPPKKPELKDFQTEGVGDIQALTAYTEALVDWSTKQGTEKALSERDLKDSQDKQVKEDIRLRNGYEAGVPDAEKRYGGRFSTSIRNANLNFTLDTTREIAGAETLFNEPGLSHDIMYHLAKREDVKNALNNASPVRAGIMIGDISRRIINLKQIKPKKDTAAPKPVTMMKGGVKRNIPLNKDKSRTLMSTLIQRQGGRRHV